MVLGKLSQNDQCVAGIWWSGSHGHSPKDLEAVGEAGGGQDADGQRGDAVGEAGELVFVDVPGKEREREDVIR